MLRTFIAVDFPLEIIDKARRIITYLKTQTPENALKWVVPENLHLTLTFLGDIPEEDLEQIRAITSEALKSQPPFEITIEGLGLYPGVKNPRVVWLGITGSQPLIDIHNKLDQALQKADVTPENRDYSPHLTIARVRRHTDHETAMEIGKTLSHYKVDTLGDIKIEEIQLYQSKLTPQGPIYTKLLTVPLNKV
jgi:2'-5' RNA ligase